MSSKPSKTTAQGPSISEPLNQADKLPPPVAAIRQKILEACRTNDIEALRIPIDWNEMRPLFARGVKVGPGFDPIALICSLSYDGKGREYLTLLRNVLRQSFVRVKQGAHESYVWPAFALRPPNEPTPEDRQIMLSCVAFADLRAQGAKSFPPIMRASFGADGVWHYFWSYDLA